MMRKRKVREIQTAIREVMQNNVIDLALLESKKNADEFRQSGKLFLYLEIKGTKPAICHVYDMEKPVRIGRNETINQICIQDITVSRDHAVIWQQNGVLFLAGISNMNPTGLKRGMHTTWLMHGQAVALASKDTVLVGSLHIRIRIFRGENEIV